MQVHRCSDCSGKFGPSPPGGRCELCWYLNRLQEHLGSPRFPAEASPLVIPFIREAYYKVLDTSEIFWGTSERAPGRREEKKEEPKDEKPDCPDSEVTAAKKQDLHPLPAPKRERSPSRDPVVPDRANSVLNLTAKAATKPPASSSCKEEIESGAEEEVEVPSRDPTPEPREETHHKRRRKHTEKRSKKDKSQGRRSRSRSHHRHRRGDGENQSSPRESRKKKKGPTPERHRSRTPVRPSKKPSEERRSHPRPRTPDRPPPARSQWVGPILARGSRQGSEEGRWRSPPYKNKGIKKRDQQARVRHKGGGGKGYWR